MDLDVKKYLPHRKPFLFVDGVKQLEDDKSILAYKNIVAEENCFEGHFPGNPVFPGVLMVEALAQAACVLMVKSSGVDVSQLNTYLTKIEQATFKRLVVPGEVLDLQVDVLTSKTSSAKSFYKFKGIASINGELACQVEFMAAVLKK